MKTVLEKQAWKKDEGEPTAKQQEDEEEEEEEIERKFKKQNSSGGIWVEEGTNTESRDKRNEKSRSVFEYIWSLADKKPWRGECSRGSYLLEDRL